MNRQCGYIDSSPFGRDRDQALTWLAFTGSFGHPSTAREASVSRIPTVIFAWTPFEHAQPPERPKGHHVTAATTTVPATAATNALSTTRNLVKIYSGFEAKAHRHVDIARLGIGLRATS